jgi:hypothetical protein
MLLIINLADADESRCKKLTVRTQLILAYLCLKMVLAVIQHLVLSEKLVIERIATNHKE